MSLHSRLAHYHARRVHVSDIPEASVRALHWLRWEKEHRDILADARRWHHSDMVDFASDEIEYARNRWLAEWAKARSLRLPVNVKAA